MLFHEKKIIKVFFDQEWIKIYLLKVLMNPMVVGMNPDSLFFERSSTSLVIKKQKKNERMRFNKF